PDPAAAARGCRAGARLRGAAEVRAGRCRPDPDRASGATGSAPRCTSTSARFQLSGRAGAPVAAPAAAAAGWRARPSHAARQRRRPAPLDRHAAERTGGLAAELRVPEPRLTWILAERDRVRACEAMLARAKGLAQRRLAAHVEGAESQDEVPVLVGPARLLEV